MRAPVSGYPSRSAANRFLHDDELLRILVGKRAEQHSIDHTEYRRVCADAESEGEDSDSREARGLAQHAEAEANVLQELLEPNETPHLACLFLHARDVAEFTKRGIPRFLRRHTPRDVVLGLSLDVIANVPVEVFHHSLASSHGSSPAGRRIRAIAAVSLSHLLVSVASCLRPLGVSR